MRRTARRFAPRYFPLPGGRAPGRIGPMIPGAANRLSACLWLGLASICLFAAPQKDGPSVAAFDGVVQPFLSRHCVACHNGRTAAGGLNVQTLNSPASLTENRDEWEKIVRRISSGEMPPKTLPRPSAGDVKAVTTWLQNEFDRADRKARADSARRVTAAARPQRLSTRAPFLQAA